MPASTPARTDTATNGHGAETPAGEHAGHAPVGRLVAQRGLFRGPNPVCPDELYVNVTRGEAVRERQRMVVQPWSTASTDTYFGRFAASYWQRWTVSDEVAVELVVSGSGRLSVVASDAESETRAVAGEVITDARHAEVRLTARLDRFLDGGHLWLDIDTEGAGLEIESLRWSVEPPASRRPTAVVICTFNRADDCLRTLRALAADPEALAVLDAVHVVDQGTDTVGSRPGFAETDAALGGRLRYLRQPNLGGAGGFSRGLYEITQGRTEPVNVLFMDDDVLLDPEIAIRLTAFASRTHEPTIVGGQMLRLLKPTHLVAGAEYADFAQLRPGMVVDGALEDVDLLAEELDEDEIPTGKPNRGDVRVDAGYNAWWACLIPAEAVAELGYPLPLFFQWDDVEYGYRARARGFTTVTLPGAGLWHQDFDSKDLDKWSEYFAVRNAMIVAALHAEVSPKQTARVLAARIVRNLLSMRYGLAATLIKAVEDYLAGPGILADGGMAAAAEIHRLRATYPDTVLHRPEEVPDVRSGRVQVVKAAATPSLIRLVLLKRLLSLALGRTAHGNGAVAAADAEWWHLAQFDNAVVTDASQQGVRLLHRDRAQMVSIARWAARVIRRFVVEAPRLKEEYRAAVPELTSRENWQRLYGR
jgi:galactofuranosylgalactofuranosylrhamnosyl-N-acetylglucosaminyl-diphospho-decaprenol beta-1,5/1,6-galactofuranosyltransferase